MKRFEYADEKISEKELLFAVPSVVIGVGILSLPRDLAAETIASDGWISIGIGGIIAILIAMMIARLSGSFPNQSFISYTSLITTKPVAIVLTFCFAIITIQITALQVRQLADISKEYLFDETPVEVIALSFLLIVVYAVSGSRVGLFRLNMMFLPFILIISTLVMVFEISDMNVGHLLPMFKTDHVGYMEGISLSIRSYGGFGVILLFYIGLVKQPKNVTKTAVIGMSIPLGLYIFTFILCIAVFGNAVTANLLYPTIELAKEVEIPGEFFERIDSLFFLIYIMAIFNTSAMVMDISAFALTSIFKKVPKRTIVFILSPVIYLIAMYPQEFTEVSMYSKYVGYSTFSYTVCVVILLTVIAKIRGVKRGE